jgi:hypothetical protein
MDGAEAMSKKADLFSCVQCNALYQALLDCSEDESKMLNRLMDADRYDVYEYMSKSARTSFIAELVQKLKENGFEIVEHKP